MLDIRSLSKRISTYLNIGKVDIDGRYRSSYKPVGAETGRLSSGETIFGTGGNQQNWPHDLLRFFFFDEGYIGYSIDLSQIENRIVAYVGGVLSQIEAFEQGIDLHRLTASQ
jgi:DNA polymerase I